MQRVPAARCQTLCEVKRLAGFDGAVLVPGHVKPEVAAASPVYFKAREALDWTSKKGWFGLVKQRTNNVLVNIGKNLPRRVPTKAKNGLDLPTCVPSCVSAVHLLRRFTAHQARCGWRVPVLRRRVCCRGGHQDPHVGSHIRAQEHGVP